MIQALQIGMLADEVLALPGYERDQSLRGPEKVGEDDQGLVVRWFYPGLSLTLRRWAVDGVEGYRVAEVDVEGEGVGSRE